MSRHRDYDNGIKVLRRMYNSDLDCYNKLFNMRERLNPELIQRKLIEFIRLGIPDHVQVMILMGNEGKTAAVDAIAGLFLPSAQSKYPVFGIVTDRPDDDPFRYAHRIPPLEIPDPYLKMALSNEKDYTLNKQWFTLNALPIVAVLFGRERGDDNEITDHQVVQLHVIRGYDPAEALKNLSHLAMDYQVQHR